MKRKLLLVAAVVLLPPLLFGQFIRASASQTTGVSVDGGGIHALLDDPTFLSHTISAGSEHTCGVRADGTLACWGANDYGQLGDGTTTDHNTPVDVSGLSSSVVAVAAGADHTCALTMEGGVKCWGRNDYGQLGDGTTTNRSTPVDVSGLTSGVAAVTAGGDHTCALTTAGGLKCWGDNSHGQLGDGTTTMRTTPVDVSGLSSSVVVVAAGADHTCALTTAGGLKCWGYNYDAELGDGTTTDRHTPVGVSGLTSGVAAVAAGGAHTCALTTAGGLKCWGYNWFGQLGNDATTTSNTPMDVPGLTSGVAAVVAGLWHTCALTTGGGVMCWGYNELGQLGDGTDSIKRHTPAYVSGLSSGAGAVAAGANHTCALTTEGSLKCWGDNGSGQLGDGTTTRRTTPVDVSDLTSGVVAVAAGGDHTCALTAAGGLKCWGWNLGGQVGDGTTTMRSIPVDVSDLAGGVVAVAAGGWHTCALTTGGGLKCWGLNSNGQLGDGTSASRRTPVDVSGLTSGVVAVAAGYYHTCALPTAGGLKCWGSNGYGQVGDGIFGDRKTPVDVSGLSSGVVAVAAGYYHTCALTTAGGVKCWGRNNSGQLGDGTTTDRSTPVDVSGLSSGVVAVTAGYYHTCALTTAGALKCWGANYGGELGDGTTTNRSTPVDVSGLTSGVVAAAAGGSHTCALTAAGGLKCWGWNLDGQVGDGTTTMRSIPVDVSELAGGAVAVAAGGSHTCALATAGGLKCWGLNYDGQLGNGEAGHQSAPVDVVDFVGGPPPPPPPTPTATQTPAPTATPGPDSDGDSCPDQNEQFIGFDSLNSHDFFDVPVPINPDPNPNGSRNRAITFADALAVLRYVGTFDGDGGTLNGSGVSYDSNKMGPGTKAGWYYDRSASPPPNPPFDAGPPNGTVTMSDVLVVVAQVGLDCSRAIIPTPTITPTPTATPTPTVTPTPNPAAINAAIQATIDLVGYYAAVVSVERVDWPDSCLGLPGPGGCLELMVPGYRITITAGSTTLVWRTDLDGRTVRLEGMY